MKIKNKITIITLVILGFTTIFTPSYSVTYDKYGWTKDGINKDTGTKYNQYGWNKKGLHKDTGTKYNPQGWTIDNKNKATGTIYDKNGFTINGINHKTGTKYNEKGFDAFGNKKEELATNSPLPVSTAPINRLDIQKDLVIPSTEQIKENKFKNSRISLSTENSFITKYSGDNHEGNFSDNNFTSNQIEFYTEKGDLGYSVFAGEKREGKFYNNENNLEEVFVGGKLIKYFPGTGFIYGGLKYYDGESEGYYNDYGKYIEKDETGKENKIRGEIGGYVEKNLYFLSGYVGTDKSSKSEDPVYEDGSYGELELGKKVPYGKDYIIPSVDVYGENYESYSFYDIALKLGYQHNYDKGYVIPFVGVGLIRDENYESGNSDYTNDPAGKLRLGVRGNHKFNDRFGVTYGIFWQSETRDYDGSTGDSDLIWTYLSLDYYL